MWEQQTAAFLWVRPCPGRTRRHEDVAAGDWTWGRHHSCRVIIRMCSSPYSRGLPGLTETPLWRLWSRPPAPERRHPARWWRCRPRTDPRRRRLWLQRAAGEDTQHVQFESPLYKISLRWGRRCRLEPQLSTHHTIWVKQRDSGNWCES